MILGAAVQSRSKDSRHRGLSNPAMPAEDIAMGRSPLLDGILERPGNVLLSNHLGEPLWTVFAGQDGVTHEVEEMIIRD
jgi:hypothetical protein